MLTPIWHASAGPSTRMNLLLASLLCLAVLLGTDFAAPARAEEDAVDNFDALYEDSAGQATGRSGAGIAADPVVDEEAWDAVLERRKRDFTQLNSKTHHPDRYADLSKREGNWELAPIVAGRRQDGEANPSEVMAPVGLELNRDF